MTLELNSRGIRDEDIHDAAPLVRALLVERLEQIWSICQPHVTGGVGELIHASSKLGSESWIGWLACIGWSSPYQVRISHRETW